MGQVVRHYTELVPVARLGVPWDGKSGNNSYGSLADVSIRKLNLTNKSGASVYLIFNSCHKVSTGFTARVLNHMKPQN